MGVAAPRPIYFGMVTTARSRAYTPPAIASFYKHTPLHTHDRFFLIDNDGDFTPPTHYTAFEYHKNVEPLSFAQNVNTVVTRAAHADADVLFLNNDIIFTPHWLTPLRDIANAICVPMCNQYMRYHCGDLRLTGHMRLEDYAHREHELEQIVSAHRAGEHGQQLHQIPFVPFYCVRLPHNVYSAVGLFDTSFSPGGGEDVDYRIRAHLAGFPTYVVGQSYLLHFMGQSTWLGGETSDETQARDDAYRARFRAKWGKDMSDVFLSSNHLPQTIERLGLTSLLQAHDYLGIIRHLLARRGSEGDEK